MKIIKNQIAYVLCELSTLKKQINESNIDYKECAQQAENLIKQIKASLPTCIFYKGSDVERPPFWQEDYMVDLLFDCESIFYSYSVKRSQESILQGVEEASDLLKEAQTIKFFIQRIALSAISQKVTAARKLIYKEFDNYCDLTEKIKEKLEKHRGIAWKNDLNNINKSRYNRFLNNLQNLYDEVSPIYQQLKKIYVFMEQMPVN